MSSDVFLTLDSKDVQRVFRAYPEAATRRLGQLVEAGTIDVQREMAINAPVGATGDMRRAVKYKIDRFMMRGEVTPTTPYAAAVENGSRPHFVSVKPGSSLRKWADHKGINPWAVQASIAKKGTKAHPFVKPTYVKMKPKVESDIIQGFNQFVQQVDHGAI